MGLFGSQGIPDGAAAMVSNQRIPEFNAGSLLDRYRKALERISALDALYLNPWDAANAAKEAVRIAREAVL